MLIFNFVSIHFLYFSIKILKIRQYIEYWKDYSVRSSILHSSQWFFFYLIRINFEPNKNDKCVQIYIYIYITLLLLQFLHFAFFFHPKSFLRQQRIHNIKFDTTVSIWKKLEIYFQYNARMKNFDNYSKIKKEPFWKLFQITKERFSKIFFNKVHTLKNSTNVHEVFNFDVQKKNVKWPVLGIQSSFLRIIFSKLYDQ